MKCYEKYFWCKTGDFNKKWVPHICCVSCVRLFNGWKNGTHNIPFAIPMVWREPSDHSTDCYFCLTDIKGFTSKSKRRITYPKVPSAMRPVLHSELYTENCVQSV